jgi:hypothetical protein
MYPLIWKTIIWKTMQMTEELRRKAVQSLLLMGSWPWVSSRTLGATRIRPACSREVIRPDGLPMRHVGRDVGCWHFLDLLPSH